MSTAAIREIFAPTEKFEDIYPLSPMQQGLLFHTLEAPESGVYCEQVALELEGNLEEEAFRQAWARVVERHTILRTSFMWEGLEEPLQLVRRRVRVPIEVIEWSGH